MGDMLSQAEIDALLNGGTLNTEEASTPDTDVLSSQEIDALGEIGNISMGTSATTLFTLLGHKVTITTPKVTVTTWKNLINEYSTSHVAVKVEYTNGLIGSNLLILKEKDVKVITDLMMGGDGSQSDGDISDLHLSAISEAMNQMVGSASTSMSAMFDKRIDISPPRAFVFTSDRIIADVDFKDDDLVVRVAFKMVVGELIDSEIMQILPLPFAKDLVENLLNMDTGTGTFEIPKEQLIKQSDVQEQPVEETPPPAQMNQQEFNQPPQQPVYDQQPMYNQPVQPDYGYSQHSSWETGQQQNRGPVNVQPAQFQSFDDSKIVLERRNISLIMDVPLQVTVELGRTKKLIKEILELGPGSIIELDKMAGEPVDIMVNGKPIAKGEVVVIDESFGVRITDIIHPSKRL